MSFFSAATRFLAVPLLAASVAVQPALASEEIADQVSAYLNSVETITGEFMQIAPGNVITEGEFAIRRPGRMFFSYEPPNPTRVVSDGIWVAVFDEEDDPAIDRYPLIDTPLYLLLKDDLDLHDEDAIRTVEETSDQYRLTVVDPSGDTEGEIILVFDKTPIRLRQWIVIDPQGRMTTVVLRGTDFNSKVDNALFVIDSPNFE